MEHLVLLASVASSETVWSWMELGHKGFWSAASVASSDLLASRALLSRAAEPSVSGQVLKLDGTFLCVSGGGRTKREQTGTRTGRNNLAKRRQEARA